MYNNIIIVATGGGIAPVIPCLVLNKKTRIVVIWIAHCVKKSFAEEQLSKLNKKISGQDIIFHVLNTRLSTDKKYTNGDYSNLIVDASKHYNSEAVFVVSNKNFTVDVLYCLRQSKVKAYGANFDS